MKNFKTIFPSKKPVIACVHLLPLPGAPLYGGDMGEVYRQALGEAKIFREKGVDGMIVGSYFKPEGNGDNLVDVKRVEAFMRAVEGRAVAVR